MKTTTPTKMLTAGDVAGTLYRAFGPAREWSDFLSDCRRECTSFCGLRLMPRCELHDGTRYRPVYAASDVGGFIRLVLAKKPELAKGGKLTPIMVDLDTSDTRKWHQIKIKPIASAASLTHSIHRPVYAATGTMHFSAARKTT